MARQVGTSMSSDMPMRCSGTNGTDSARLIRNSVVEAALNTLAAAILPSTSSARETGCESRGSSEPCSRSPAVASMASRTRP